MYHMSVTQELLSLEDEQHYLGMRMRLTLFCIVIRKTIFTTVVLTMTGSYK